MHRSNNLDDIITHEVGGHKRYWDHIKKYADENGISIEEAKEIIDEPIRKYIAKQRYSDINYLRKAVSRYSGDKFDESKQVNEIVAEMAAHIQRGDSADKELERLVKEALGL